VHVLLEFQIALRLMTETREKYGDQEKFDDFGFGNVFSNTGRPEILVFLQDQER